MDALLCGRALLYPMTRNRRPTYEQKDPDRPGRAVHRGPAQTGPVTVKVMAYEPETYYSAGSVLLQTQLFLH